MRPTTDVRLEEGGFEGATKDFHAEKGSTGTPILSVEKNSQPLIMEKKKDLRRLVNR